MRFKSDITSEAQLILEKYISTNYDGTLSYVLGVDGSGNVIKQAATDFLTSVPTLQQVTAIGNSTDQGIVFNTGATTIGSIKNTSGVLHIEADSTRDIKLGSTSSGDILFLEGSNGNVGIGTTSPSGRLNIQSAAASTYLLNLDYADGTDGGGFYEASSTDLSLYLKNSSGTNTVIIATDGDSFFNGGNVGIGTTSPSAKLHVKGSNSGASGVASGTLVVEQGSAPSIQMLSTNTQTQSIKFGDPEDGGVGRITYSHNDNKMNLVTNTTTALTIDDSQNVGINKTSPSAKLHVVGGARATGATSFLVENTEGDDLLKVNDDNEIFMYAYAVHVGTDTANSADGYKESQATTSYPSAAGTYLVYTSETNKDVISIDYKVNDGTNYRTGTVTAITDGTSTSITDITKAEIGDTSGIDFLSEFSGGALKINLRKLSGFTCTAKFIIKNF